MHRRTYLAGLGGATSGYLAVPVTSAVVNDPDRLRPPEEQFTIQPDTEVLFETSTNNVDWTVDDESVSGVFFHGYPYYSGNGAISYQFESGGNHRVSATDHERGDSVRWEINVDDDGAPAPMIEDFSTHPGESEVIGVNDSVEVTVTATDPEGVLELALFEEGQNQTDIYSRDIAGENDTATYEWEEAPHWFAGAYPTGVAVVTEDGRVSEPEWDNGPEIRPPFEVEILETDAPVTAGEELAVVVAVENPSTMYLAREDTQEIELLVGDDMEPVDATSVTLDGVDRSTTTTLHYETYPVEQAVEFPIRVESPDFYDETLVEVVADDTGDDSDPALALTIVSTNAPVTGGEFLSVTVQVENTGTGPLEDTLELIVGGERVDTTTVQLDGGEATEQALGYETYPVQQDVSVTLRVEAVSATAADEHSVSVDGVN